MVHTGALAQKSGSLTRQTVSGINTVGTISSTTLTDVGSIGSELICRAILGTSSIKVQIVASIAGSTLLGSSAALTI